MNDHLEDKKIVDKTLGHFYLDPDGSGYKLLENLIDEAKKLFPDKRYTERLIPFILKKILKERQVVSHQLVKTTEQTLKRHVNQKVLFTFAIGE